MTVYLTGAGAYLPGAPLDNEQVAQRLGDTMPGLRKRIMAGNGIRTRHLAADQLNEDLAAHAVQAALKDRGIDLAEVGLLATGTTQGDLLVPGFASMVHGRLGGAPMEILSSGGVCASGMAALAAAVRALECGDHDRAVVVGSELVSRSSKNPGRTADTEFLRWTLSDGAGAVVLERRPRADAISLRVDWTHLVSHAHAHNVCMSASLEEMRLRQDVSMLPDLFRTGVGELQRLVDSGKVDLSEVDHLLCHYSAERFRGELVRLMREGGVEIPQHKWFSNLSTRGNTGAASIFIMLEEAWHSGRFQPGERILLAVPESGRFSFALVHLTAVAPSSLTLDLARVWSGFEARLRETPMVQRIEARTATIEDYRRLLLNLRQQVIEGGRWISRAASNFTLDEFRAAAIQHAAAEHRDFRLLERDYAAAGGRLADIQRGRKNIGSEALSAFVFQQAGHPDPVDLLGAMFVIEGLGNRLAMGWARMLQTQLSLSDASVSFLRYHGEADEGHLAELTHLLTLLTPEHEARVVRTAEVVARLYALQIEEMG
jgi:3-oxoacyl-[acyl-carrier-protein] synthase III